MGDRQFLRSFDNWKLNESYDMGAGPSDSIVKELIKMVDEAVALDNWREANRMLREFVKTNEKALAEADGTEVLTALEPWYDTYKNDWEADSAEFQEEDPLAQDDEEFNFEDEPEADAGTERGDDLEAGLDQEDDDWD